MTLLQRSLLLPVRQVAAILAGASASLLIACSSPAASNGVAASPSNAAEVRAEPTEVSANDVPSSPEVTAHDRAIDPVDLVVKRDLWPLEPAAAEKLLQSLGQVRREAPIPHAVSLVGGPTATLARFDVSYAQDDEGRWTMNAASFFLGDADLGALYQRLETRITKRLGKPEWSEKQNDLPSSGWSLGRDMSLLLAPSPNQGERLVVLSISEPEGEAE